MQRRFTDDLTGCLRTLELWLKNPRGSVSIAFAYRIQSSILHPAIIFPETGRPGGLRCLLLPWAGLRLCCTWLHPSSDELVPPGSDHGDQAKMLTKPSCMKKNYYGPQLNWHLAHVRSGKDAIRQPSFFSCNVIMGCATFNVRQMMRLNVVRPNIFPIPELIRQRYSRDILMFENKGGR
jgi:hypothetical protein